MGEWGYATGTEVGAVCDGRTSCDDVGGEVGSVEVVTEGVDVLSAVRPLIPNADEVDVEAVHVAGSSQPTW